MSTEIRFGRLVAALEAHVREANERPKREGFAALIHVFEEL
jgi:hypothetical protein